MVATVCVVLVLLGLAAFAASVPDNDGAEAELRGPDLDVTWIQNNGEYTFMGIVFKVIKDADTEIRSDSLPGPDIIIDSSSVAEGCFSGSSIRTVLLTDRVSSIGKYAFKDCTELESFTKYAQTPLSVSADSFVGCNSLKLLDIRGNVSIEGAYLDSGKSLNLLVDPGVTDSEIPHNSLIRLGSLDGKLNGAFYKDGRILISYTGKGLLEMRSDGGVRTEYNRTIMLHDEIYSFEPFSGEDSTIAHRTFHVDFVPKDIVDCDMSVTDSVVDLLDLTYGDPEATSWKGWYEVNMEMSIGKSIDRDLIENLDIESLRLRPDSSGFSVTYKFTETPAGEKLSTITSVGCDWSNKYSAATDTKYYRCIGWVVEDDPNGIVHPVGSDIRIYKNHVVYSVWAPLDEYVYSVQYLNVDGSVLVDSDYGHGMKVSIKDVVPADETIDKMLDGWLVNGKGGVFRTGDTFTITGDVTLVPCMKDRPGHNVDFIVDGEVYATQFAGDNFPMTISCVDPLDVKRIFTGWCADEFGPFFNGESAVLDGIESLNATWRDKKSFTLTYMSEGTEVGSSLSLLEKDIVTVEADVSKAHHVLTGWSCEGHIYSTGDTFEILEDTVLTAVWEEMEKNTLTYHPYGADPVSIELYPDETATISSEHGIREHHIFLGWSTAEDGPVEYLPDDSAFFDSDTNLYTVWRESRVFTATYISDGNTIGEPEEIYESTAYTVSAETSKPHHSLKGWMCGDRLYRNGDSIEVTGDIILTAAWAQLPKYTLSYRMPSGTDATSKHYPDETVVISECIEAIDGSVFIGWSVSENADPSFLPGDRTVLASDMELYPCWRTAKEFVVSFISDGETISEPVIVKEGGQLTVHADASKPHHVLKGWSDGARTFEDGSIITPDEDIVFSAIWEEMPKYTLTYHPYGDDAFSIELYPDEKTTVSSEHGFREGHLFLGWTTSENGNPEYIIGQDLLLNDNLDLYTVWRVAAEFTVSYISDEKPLGDPVTVNEGSSIIIHFEAIKPHHILKGWTDGTTLYQDGSSIVIANNLVLTAVWEEKPKYTITYHPFDSDPVEESFYIDETAEVDCKPGIKTDFTFIGWSTTENGEAEYRNGDTIATAADLSLYPVWKHDETAPDNPPKDDPSNDKDPDVGTDDEGSGNKPSGDNDSEKDPSKPSDDDDFDDNPSIPSDEDSGDGPSPPSDDEDDDRRDDSDDVDDDVDDDKEQDDGSPGATPPSDNPNTESPTEDPEDDQRNDNNGNAEESGSKVPAAALAAICALIAAIVVVVIRRS